MNETKIPAESPNVGAIAGLQGVSEMRLAGTLVSASFILTVSRKEAADLFNNLQVPLIPSCGVKIYKLSYLTRDESGAPIQASGALVVPQNLCTAPPLVSYQHGTTTLRTDVASTSPAPGEPYQYIAALAFGTAGYITALPDYLGYGDSGHRFHPYLHAPTLASAVVDMLKATKAYCAANGILTNGKVFLTGYSEGGYATMAATKELQESHPELAITASAPMAGPYSLSTSLLEIMTSASYPGPAFLAFAFWAYDRIYDLNMLDRAFPPAVATQLDAFFDGSHELGEINPALSSEIADLFERRFVADFMGDGVADLKMRIRENDICDWVPAAPMRLLHSPTDEMVTFDNSRTAFHNFRANGARDVQLVEPVQEGSHGACALPALLAAKSWFDTFR